MDTQLWRDVIRNKKIRFENVWDNPAMLRKRVKFGLLLNVQEAFGIKNFQEFDTSLQEHHAEREFAQILTRKLYPHLGCTIFFADAIITASDTSEDGVPFCWGFLFIVLQVSTRCLPSLPIFLMILPDGKRT